VGKHLAQNQMLHHSALLLAGYAGAHLLNLLYQMVVSRTLAPTEYALLAAFIGLLLILQYPLMTLTTGLSRYSSLLMQAGRSGDVRRLLSRWLARSATAGILLATPCIVYRHTLAAMFHIDRIGPILVTALSLPVFLMLPIVLGVSQGIQRFGWNSTTTMAGSLVRLTLGSAFVLLLHPTSGWGLLGHSAGLAVNVFLLALALYGLLHKYPSTAAPLPHLRLFLAQSGAVQIAYAVLMTADVILMKHFIPTETEFAYAATLGRLAVFLSSTIVIAMFPKVTTTGPLSPQQYRIFAQSLLFTTLCAVLAVTGCWLFPQWLLRLFFGIADPSPALRYMTVSMAAIMGLSAILNTCLQFLVARQHFAPTLWVLAAAAGYLLGSTLWHQHPGQILLLAALANALPLLAILPACRRPTPALPLPAPPCQTVH